MRRLQVYQTTTSTRRNLFAMQALGWRVLFTAMEPRHWRPGQRFALDSGAWSCFTRRVDFDFYQYERAVEALGSSADFVVAPDVVGGGALSLSLSLSWLPWLRSRCRRVLLAAQDGMFPSDLAPHVGRNVGIAIGGSTAWKETQLRACSWVELCQERSAWLHVFRVNTRRRIRLCRGATSMDGTSGSRFASSIPLIHRWVDEVQE